MIAFVVLVSVFMFLVYRKRMNENFGPGHMAAIRRGGTLRRPNPEFSRAQSVFMQQPPTPHMIPTMYGRGPYFKAPPPPRTSYLDPGKIPMPANYSFMNSGLVGTMGNPSGSFLNQGPYVRLSSY